MLSIKNFDKNAKYNSYAANLIDDEAYFNKQFKKPLVRSKSAINV
jgi:hypothetical protein